MFFEFPEIELTEDQAEEAERIADILRTKAEAEVRYISRLLASKPNRELLGETEFQIRDAVHRLGAEGVDAAGWPGQSLAGCRRHRKLHPQRSSLI